MTANKNYTKWLEEYTTHKDKRIYGYLDMLSPKVSLIEAMSIDDADTLPDDIENMLFDDEDTLSDAITDTLSNVVDNLTLTEVKELLDLNVKDIYIVFFKKEDINNKNCIFESQKAFIRGNAYISTNLYKETLWIHICY